MLLYIKTAFKRFNDFKGNSSLKEFWVFFSYLFVLLNIFAIPALVSFYTQMKADMATLKLGKEVLPLSKTAPGVAILISIAFLLFLLHLIPLLSLSVRRLRDSGSSINWMWLLLIPILGPIILLVLMARKRSEINA